MDFMGTIIHFATLSFSYQWTWWTDEQETHIIQNKYYTENISNQNLPNKYMSGYQLIDAPLYRYSLK